MNTLQSLILATLAAGVVSGCDTSDGGEQGDTDTDGATTTGDGPGTTQSSADPTDDTGSGPAATTSTTGPDDDGSDVDSDDTNSGDSSGSDETCTTNCGSDDPQVVWIAEPKQELAGGSCLDVLSDGAGGAVTSFVTNPDSPLFGGLVLALDEDGVLSAQQSLEQHRVTGLERASAGSFFWVDSWANAGESSVGLDDLEGDWLAQDLLALDDLAPVSGGYAYTTISGSLFPECHVRVGAGGSSISPILPCGTYDDRWRLRQTSSGGVVAGLVGQSGLARVAADGAMSDYLEYRYQRTMLDFAVDDQDRVWTVGIVRDPDSGGPAFGSFVARHDPTLGEEPQWEVLEEGDISYAWTSIAMWQGEPILIGRDADAVPRVVALTSAGDQKWSLDLDLDPSVILERADLDEDGRLMLCGDRFLEEVPVVSSRPVVVRIDL